MIGFGNKYRLRTRQKAVRVTSYIDQLVEYMKDHSTLISRLFLSLLPLTGLSVPEASAAPDAHSPLPTKPPTFE